MYLTQGLHRSVQQTPDATMTICGDRRRTYREVADRVACLAGALRGLGVGPGDRVAILALNSDRYHEYLLAVPWAEAVLNPVNIRWSPAEIVYSLQDSETVALFIDDTFAPMLPALQEGYPGLKAVIHCGDGPTPDGMLSHDGLIAGADPVEDRRRGGEALAGLFYTGGTTGFPKGVMLSHANLITSSLGCAATGVFTPGGVYLHAAPMFHLADLAMWGIHVGDHGWVESQALHAVLRRLKPRRIIEVGSGVSTHCISQALALNERDGTPATELTSIEPYPSDRLRAMTNVRLIEKPVQEVPLDVFSSLGAGDMLFIDSLTLYGPAVTLTSLSSKCCRAWRPA